MPPPDFQIQRQVRCMVAGFRGCADLDHKVHEARLLHRSDGRVRPQQHGALGVCLQGDVLPDRQAQQLLPMRQRKPAGMAWKQVACIAQLAEVPIACD
jgi:hypothetical protein